MFKLSIAGVSFFVSFAASAAPTMIDMPVDMSLSGGKYCVSITTQCTTGWSFWQHKTGYHRQGGGIGGANDTYAWDINLNSPSFDYDNGKPVRAVESGNIYTGNNWGNGNAGQILINHSTGAGNWSTGYLHMSGIVKKSGFVNKGDIIGYISHAGAENNHLHFAVYNGWNASPTSINVLFSGKTATKDTPPGAPTLIAPANGAVNVPTSNVRFSWYAVTNANAYRIVISQNSSFSGFTENGASSTCNSTCYTTSTGNLTSFVKTMGLKNQTYYWRVRASGTGGTGAWSVVRNFRTASF